MSEGNLGILWILAGLLALMSLGQSAWLAMETRVCVDAYGLPKDLCRDVVTTGRPSLEEAAQLYRACRDEARVGSEALCSQVVRGCVTVNEAAELYRAFPLMSEWAWKHLRPIAVGYMLNPAHRDWPWKSLLLGRVSIGMTDVQVLIAWWLPTTINRTITAFDVREQWVYRGGRTGNAYHLYFRDGVLTTIEVRG